MNCLFFSCAKYIGGHPGQAIADCNVYDHNMPSGQQWSPLPDLPAPRAGGGLLYVEQGNYILFSAGAVRPIVGNANADDYGTTWTLSLGQSGANWVQKATLPFAANHISFASGRDGNNVAHHYFMGGQESENEQTGNNKNLYEWIPSTEQWVKRADMPFERGHASSSTTAFGCGFVILAGAINGGKTSDISYYDIANDSWIKVGDMDSQPKTPVCAINSQDWLYCISPYGLNDKRQIGF